ALVPFPHLGRDLAADGGFDRVLDIGDVQPIAGRAVPVDGDLQLRHLAGAIDEGAVDAPHVGDRVQHVGRSLTEDVGIFAEHLDHDLSVDLGDALEHVVADRLRDGDVDAGNRGQAAL